MVAAVYVPLWASGLAVEALLFVAIVVGDARKRRARRAARDRQRALRDLCAGVPYVRAGRHPGGSVDPQRKGAA